MVDTGLYIAYALFGIAALASIVFPLIYTLRNVSDAKKSLAGVGALVLIVIVTYFLSSGEFYFDGIEKFDMTASQIKVVSTGLNTFYVLLVLAIIASVVSEVSSVFK